MSSPPSISPERWQHIIDAFHAAIDAAPADRDAVLDQICGDDADLRASVQHLLNADAEASVLVPKAAGPRLSIEHDPAKGRQVGPYQLGEEIGRGGMGVVYRATRADVGNTVAVKMLREQFPSKERTERFVREQHVLGQLEHPGIARFLDAGVTDDDTPYLVMEHVDGRPVTDAAADMDLQQRLRLVLEICDAVRYAHQNLVVHRDLKPSNVLVTTDGAVKLLDFGIAKVLEEDATITATRHRVMTLAYAAPEQVEGGTVSTATDVYALGSLLYELLTGTRPLDLDDVEFPEAVRRILHETPTAPSARGAKLPDRVTASALRGDLDTICLKALRKEPERRYESVEALRDDLQRYLSDRPITARPDSLSYRTGKFVRRNRAGVLSAALGVLVLGVVLAFYTTRLAEERDRATEQAEKAQAVTEFVTGMFEASRPQDTATDTLRAITLLEQGRRDATEMRGQPAVQAGMLNVIGDIHRGLGRYDDAEEILETAVSLHQRNDPRSIDALRSRRDLGLTLMDQSRFDESVALLREVVADAERFSNTHPTEFAESVQALGYVLYMMGNYAEAEENARRALQIRIQTFGRAHRDVAESQRAIASAIAGQGEVDEAEEYYRAALATNTSADGGTRITEADILQDLASLLADKDDLSEAEALHKKALDIRRAVLGADHPETALSHSQTALSLYRQDKLEEGRSHAEKALQIRRRVFGDDHTRTATALNQLSNFVGRMGNRDSSVALYKQSTEIYKRHFHPRHQYVGIMYANIGSTYSKMGRYEESVQYIQKGIDIMRETYGPDHWQTGYGFVKLVYPLRHLGRYQEAEAMLRQSYHILKPVQNPESISRLRLAEQGLHLYAVWQGHDVARSFVDTVDVSVESRAKLDSVLQKHINGDYDQYITGRQ